MRQLAANARRDKIRSDKVAAWRIDPSLSGIIKYFYWRSRFPIIQKLLNRSFLFLELSLIFFFFHTTIVSSMALLLLGVFAFNAIAIGLRQYFRVEIVKAQQDHHQGLASQLLTSCTIISIFLCPASAESEHFKNLLSYKSSGELRGGRYGEAKEEKTI